MDGFGYFKKGFFDRYDGWRVKNIDPNFAILPYFLGERAESQNLFKEKLYLDNIESFIKKHKEEYPTMSVMHVLVASFVRVFSQRPYLNRFIIWNKLYARNHLTMSLVVKKNLRDDSSETIIKPVFNLDDTLVDVINKIDSLVMENKDSQNTNSSDDTAKLLQSLPPWIMRIVAGTLKKLDKIGHLPKSVHRSSPWHCSFFITNLGSIGSDAIYHHLFGFGNCSMFCAMGKKKKELTVTKDGGIKEQRYIQIKFSLDERICDGFYYASSMKMLNYYLTNPAKLFDKPESIKIDDGVKKPLIKK